MSRMSNSKSSPSPDELLTEPASHITQRQTRWLKPLSLIAVCIQASLFLVNWVVMRCVFRLSVNGQQHIPLDGPFVIASNHTSSLDPCAIAAALSFAQFRSLRWAARQGVVTGGWIRETVAQLARVLPIRRSIHSLAAASAVLERGECLVWFPEGTRSKDGALQTLKSGVGYLACHHGVQVVPLIIDGAHAAMPPPRKRLRRLSRISVRFDEPLVGDAASGDELNDRAHEFTARLAARMEKLAQHNSQHSDL